MYAINCIEFYQNCTFNIQQCKKFNYTNVYITIFEYDIHKIADEIK